MAMLDQHEHKQPEHNFDGIVENRVNSPPLYFSVLFYGLIIWGAIFIGYFLLSGWSSESEFEEKMAAHQERIAAARSGEETAVVAAKPQEEILAEGKNLFAGSCAMCHGAEGEGGIGSSLAAAAYKYGTSEEAIRASIAEGRPGGMPGFGLQFSPEQVDSLVQFVISLQK
jgi:cytochrome c oxidase cbb3-type subunit III